MYLEHQFNGPELKLSYAKDTLQNVYQLWKRPVTLETVIGENVTRLRWDETGYSVDATDEVVRFDEDDTD